MRITLDLTRHCVETEIRRQHERTVAEALRPTAEPSAAETRLVWLRSALEGLDFPRLRSDHAALNAESRAEVALEISGDRRRIQLRLDGKTAAEAPLREEP
ncbi:MAG: hypothetical protein ACLFTV_07920 [Desulfococcaceae bacterium]